MKQRLIAALLCLCMGMSMLSPAAAAQGPGGLSTGDDSGATLTTGDDSGSAPAAGDDSGSGPAAGDDRGSAPAAGDDSGSAPTTGDDSGSAPTTGDEGGAARILLNAPSARSTVDELWDALGLKDGMYLPYTGSLIEPEIFSVELVEDRDYTVSYKTASGTALPGAPADVGEYYVVLTGIWAIYIRKTSKRIR